MILDILTQTNSLIGIGSFLAGYIKSEQLNKHEIMKIHAQGRYKMQSEARKDKSISSIAGRFLVVGTVLGMVFYIIVVSLTKNIPLTIETVQRTSWLGRFFYGPSRIMYTTLHGAVIPSWMPQVIFGAMMYWFGVQRK